MGLRVEEVPSPRQTGSWVTDTANILSPETEAELNRQISQPVVTILCKGLAIASLAGGINCLLFSCWLSRSRIKKIAPPETITIPLVTAVAACISLVVALPFILIFGGLFFMFIELVLPGLSASILIGLIVYHPFSLIPKKIFCKDRNRRSIRPLHCTKCRQPMQQIHVSALSSYLRKPEKVAQKLGSVAFEVWQCPTCHPKLIGQGINLRAYVLNSKQFSLCPRCQELTVTHTQKVLISATTYSQGKKLITDECHCCSYRKETEQTIPRIIEGGGDGGGGGGGGDGGGGGSGGGGAGG